MWNALILQWCSHFKMFLSLFFFYTHFLVLKKSVDCYTSILLALFVGKYFLRGTLRRMERSNISIFFYIFQTFWEKLQKKKTRKKNDKGNCYGKTCICDSLRKNYSQSIKFSSNVVNCILNFFLFISLLTSDNFFTL